MVFRAIYHANDLFAGIWKPAPKPQCNIIILADLWYFKAESVYLKRPAVNVDYRRFWGLIALSIVRLVFSKQPRGRKEWHSWIS